MPNTYFQFKQFVIHQEQTSMKVTTDACLFGAWVKTNEATRILDIGTGTGLLALMLAQKTNDSVEIHAVETDENSAEQAKQNIQGSPWTKRVKVFHQRIQDFQIKEKYDLIICNPPFFKNHLISANKAKNQALHQVSLTFNDLLKAVDRLISPEGNLVILLPAYEMQVFQNLGIQQGFHPIHQLDIYNQPEKAIFRQAMIFCQETGDLKKEEIYIRDKLGGYSQEFVSLLKSFYLNF